MRLPAYSSLPAWLRALRPEQWTKNALVLAAFFFAYADPAQGLRGHGLRSLLSAVAASAVFCLASSAVYLFNDVHDREDDVRHPAKRLRPVASGEIPPDAARLASALLAAFALGAAALLAPRFAAVVAAYVAMQLGYTLLLKQTPILDVIVVATGFVMRAVAGAAVLGVVISPWLVLCTFFLSLFLALCKRRQEKTTKDEGEQRPTLRGYSVALLDQLISVSASSTLVSYALYTLSPATVAKFHTPLLGLTIPFVVFGVFRYLYLVYVRNEGERPERTLLSDVPLLATAALFFATAAALLLA